MGGSPSKRPRPSYEEGELRDKSIAKKQNPKYRGEDLLRLIKQSAKKARERA